MRLSLSVDPCEGTCSKCGAGPVLLLTFGAVVESFAGEAEKLCQSCLFHFGGNRVDIEMESLVSGPAPRRKALKKGRQTSLRQEVELAEALGGKTQPGSGNQRGAKGDIRKKGELRVEAKFTAAASYTLKLEELQKIAGECGAGEKPIFVIDYIESGTKKLKDRYAVLHFNDFQEFLNASRQHR